MSSRRVPASSFAAVVLTVAVSLLGVGLFLAGSPAACADSGAACCCAGSSADTHGGQEEGGGCGCTVSPAAPVPVAILASVGGIAPPVLLAEVAEVRAVEGQRAVPAVTRTLAAARSAPTQALLETFRN